ncbi:hypothetical protein PA598K_06851 [Paenibacillus sp. 598K]|uniref:transglycosylase domain-containing protein n=1 Tax=Paenibacillus sp. 598K TaxID=1117987 RepID=UPI000FF9484E|nr:PBP1A family penicillin-binding protein [Paenibacillus sp. 598K]GBF78234.1 hypothetical protein PA598K_06851 [Paenibacillus sp. 598K]
MTDQRNGGRNRTPAGRSTQAGARAAAGGAPSGNGGKPAKPVKTKTKTKGKRRITGKRVLLFLFFGAAFAVVCGIIGYLIIILNGEKILAENKDKLALSEASVIYDAQGKEIDMLYVENRELVEFAEIPELMRQAFIATEDKRFEDHSGIDFWSIGRAVVKDVIARKAVEGGSTITQQLAKNMFLNHDKTLLRKATEASIAVALENNFTKDDILTMYLNRIFFGQRSFGVKAASIRYFGKENLEDLELWEIATLAGIPKAPSVYNPLSNAEESKKRRGVVLQLMYDQGIITEQQMNEAKAAEYNPDNQKEPVGSTKYMAFIDYAINEAIRVTGKTEEELRLGGYRIHTTLNSNAQGIMEQEFADAANFEESSGEQIVQGAMIIIDHRTGEIESMVGGRDYVKKGLNRVTVNRQPGSSFKPISSYGPALETGDWLPSSILRDDEICYDNGKYCPKDSNRVKYIGPVTMKDAIKESRNQPAVWLLNEIGVQKGVDFANNLGFNLDVQNDRNLAIALGGLTNGVTPMQMATAYSVFANGGKSVDPHSIARITNSSDKLIYEYEAPKPQQLIKPETAWYLTEIMLGVTERGGTGTRAKMDRPLAGKTGTTQHGVPGLRSSANRDVWFVGYTPEWTGAVWMGYDRTDKDHVLKNSSGISAALFAKIMSAALKDAPASQFVRPGNVQEIKPPSGVPNLSAVYVAERGDVQLSWSAVSGNNVTYRIYRKEAKEAQFTRLMDGLDAIATEDATVQPGYSYVYYVTAYDGVTKLEGGASSQVTVAVPEIELDPFPDTEEPEQPEVPEQPGNGEQPGQPGQPDDGGQPGQPGNGTSPGDNSGTPGDPGTEPPPTDPQTPPGDTPEDNPTNDGTSTEVDPNTADPPAA